MTPSEKPSHGLRSDKERNREPVLELRDSHLQIPYSFAVLSKKRLDPLRGWRVNNPGVSHENTDIVAILITVEVQSDSRVPSNVPQLGLVPFGEDQNCSVRPMKPDGPRFRSVVSIDGNEPNDLLLAKPALTSARIGC